MTYYLSAKLTYWMGSVEQNSQSTLFTGTYEASDEVQAKLKAMDALRKARGNLEAKGYRVRESYELIPVG